MKKVLVTGGLGKLGRWVVKELERYYDVLVVDRRIPVSSDGLNSSFELIDLNQSDQLDSVLKNVDAVVHLAAIPNPIARAPKEVFENNVMTTFNVVESAVTAGVGKIIYSGSGSALGFAFRFKDMIPDYMPMDELHPLRPQDAYGLSKALCEDILLSATRRSGISTISLRATTVFEPSDYAKKVPDALNNPKGGIMAYVDARDYANAVLLTLKKNNIEHDRFFIAADDALSREPLSIAFPKMFPGSELVALGLTGTQGPINCAKAKTILGYCPIYSWRQFVKEN
jgi:UDP-glucose 4-epimerase